jgi:membrane-bound serine protease (ClpP class)
VVASANDHENLLNQPVKGSAKILASLFLCAWALTLTHVANAQEACTLKLKIEGAITPGTYDYFTRGLKRADELGCGSMFLVINTPGGALNSTRLIVEKILNSKIPVFCLVAPAGARAGSAGAIILEACHVNGALTATNIGAATPVTGNGAALSPDMRAKMIADTVAFSTSLARLRNRSLTFAEKIVTEAKAVDSTEAFKLKAIDILADDEATFLNEASGREVTMSEGKTQKTHAGPLQEFAPDFRQMILQLVLDPEIAYLIFMASLGLIYFEITHPGMVAPGIAGTMGLIISLMAFHQLDVWWGGVSLIAGGLVLFVIEGFLPTFGALGVGGILAFAAGSFLLYEPGSAGLSLALILTTTVLIGAVMLALAWLGFRTRRMGRARNETALLDHLGMVASLQKGSHREGMVQVRGENWRFTSDRDDVKVGDEVQIISQTGFSLKIQKAREPSER